jgi:tRNA (adenine57-N1/adenine58-N1)-methyltransferase catalytic subunit
MSVAREGDLVLLVSQEHKRYLIRLRAGEAFYSHRGSIEHDALIGQPLGRTVYTQHNHAYLALEPGTHDLLQDLPRASQIIYGKDAAHIVLRMNLYPGRTVVEAGTGSGGLTLVLARTVMPGGHVYSYETRPDSYEIARGNLDELDLMPYVTLYNEDISGGFHERDVDACFLDLREPWLFLDHAWDSLKGSGFFGALVPTTNQVSELVAGLQSRPFGDILVEEVMVRAYKPVPARLRPEDRMLAHSAFMIFARKIARDDESLRWVAEKRHRTYLARQAMEARSRSANTEEDEQARERSRSAILGPRHKADPA